MYKTVSVLVITLSCVVLSRGDSCPAYCPDYYWRDFTGTIPHDAFVGATDRNDTLYVGQVFFKEWNLLPATIYDRTGLAYTTAYNKFLVSGEYVKILASPDNSVFEWIPVESKDLHLYINRAIPGGSEVGQPIYIGRVKYGEEMMIGKVFKDDQTNKGLWLQKFEQEHKNFLSYELLAYNCNKKTINVNKAQALLAVEAN